MTNPVKSEKEREKLRKDRKETLKKLRDTLLDLLLIEGDLLGDEERLRSGIVIEVEEELLLDPSTVLFSIKLIPTPEVIE